MSSMPMAAATDGRTQEWTDVCAYDELLPERGVAALVAGQQVALFRLAGGDVLAVGHHDPFSSANVMARGIVGTRSDVDRGDIDRGDIDRGDIDTVASPVYKQVFDLRTGQCLDDDSAQLPTWPVRVLDGRVEVRSEPGPVTMDP